MDTHSPAGHPPRALALIFGDPTLARRTLLGQRGHREGATAEAHATVRPRLGAGA